MAMPKDGYELLQVTVSTAAAKWVKVQAALEGLPPGQVVERVLRSAMEGSSVLDLVLNEAGRQLRSREIGATPDAMTMAAMAEADEITRTKRAAKASRRPQEAPGAASASEEARAELWQALEAHRADSGWNDGHIAEQLGIATRNVSQWRKAGMVTSTKVEAVEKLLQGKA